MKHLADISFHEADPLARILIDRLRLTPVTSAILAGFGAFAVTFLVALFTGTLSKSPGKVGYLEDWTNWLSIILFTPVLVGYYIWASDTARDILLALEDSEADCCGVVLFQSY